MPRPNYHRATRNAYRTLLACKIDRLPVDVMAICDKCQDTTLVSLSEFCDYFKNPKFDPFEDGPSRTAMAFRRWIGCECRHTILWNDDELTPGSIDFRFTIAHELAHVVLRHEGRRDPAAELEANLFAQHLLCPRPVLEVLRPCDALEIECLCRSPRGTAREAWEALKHENKYMDIDMWKSIFAAFELDKKRSVADFLSPVAILAADIRRRRYAQSVTG